jgi:hypothetical protein
MPASMHLAESLHMRCGRDPHIGCVRKAVLGGHPSNRHEPTRDDTATRRS